MPTTFDLPHWAQLPIKTLHLEVHKDGELIGKINLGENKCYKLGRHGEWADVVMDHTSISRLHAAVVLGTPAGKKGATLIDLQSVHGTYLVTNFRTRSRFKSMEPYELKEMDKIAFGASTRIYVVRGLNPRRMKFSETKPKRSKFSETKPKRSKFSETKPKKSKRSKFSETKLKKSNFSETRSKFSKTKTWTRSRSSSRSRSRSQDRFTEEVPRSQRHFSKKEIPNHLQDRPWRPQHPSQYLPQQYQKPQDWYSQYQHKYDSGKPNRSQSHNWPLHYRNDSINDEHYYEPTAKNYQRRFSSR